MDYVGDLKQDIIKSVEENGIAIHIHIHPGMVSIYENAIFELKKDDPKYLIEFAKSSTVEGFYNLRVRYEGKEIKFGV